MLRFAFYPRPPGGGRHPTWPYPENLFHISIHALRVEGDPALFRLPISFPNFYPRPPGGGRPRRRTWLSAHCPFLSALPVKRYRRSISIHALRVEGDFLTTNKSLFSHISIHALRVEGDCKPVFAGLKLHKFLSTPSGWRATAGSLYYAARRVDFYPRPPGGGRRKKGVGFIKDPSFLSTPSGWRATQFPEYEDLALLISIHALRVEGARSRGQSGQTPDNFYPRPPGGGRPCTR